MILRLEMILSVMFYGRKDIIFYENNSKRRIILLMRFFVIEFFFIIDSYKIFKNDWIFINRGFF